MGIAKTNAAGMTIGDMAQCSSCHHEKLFHGPDGCIPFAMREKDGGKTFIVGNYNPCGCKEFERKFIHVMHSDQRFSSVEEARAAGVL